ncbi:UNVERIFIED_CONTAM: hypothetical protein Sindi_0521800 [Sesamum indicum]
MDYYSTKNLIRDLGLPVEKIDTCKNGRMLYWKNDIDLDYCKLYGEARLYASKATAEQMTWHAYHQKEEESMCHPSDAEAWRHFDQTYPYVAVKPRNMVMLGPSNPKCLINVYLEPLIEELLNLWHVGVLTCDSAKNKTFTMRVVLMWTVNDLPAYGMTFGWSFAGVMGCPVCMKNTRAFDLQNDRNAYYFDCHR